MTYLTKHLVAGIAFTHMRSATLDPTGNSEGMDAQRDWKALYKTGADIVFSACYSGDPVSSFYKFILFLRIVKQGLTRSMDFSGLVFPQFFTQRSDHLVFISQFQVGKGLYNLFLNVTFNNKKICC